MSTNVQASRLAFLDAHRGLAVLLMIWMHSADGWLRPELKQGPIWDVIRSLGGLAAPTFLLLAGSSLTFGWGRAGPAAPAPAFERRPVARALQLIALGYALRLQMWMLDGAGYRQPEAWAAALPLAVGYGAAYFALQAWGRGAQAYGLWAVAAAGGTVGFGLLSTLLPDRVFALLRVDVLQAIGASLVVVSVLRTPLRRVPELGLVAGLAVALLTPWFQDLVPGPLPVALAAYVAAWPVPPGQASATLFPLFPWLAYALAGAALGMRLGRAERLGGNAARLALRLSVVGAAVALLSCEALPFARWLLREWPWALPGVRVAYRVGAALVLGGLAVPLCARWSPFGRGLVVLGQASLIVYWVHLQFAFGAAVKPIVHELDVEQWAWGFALFAAAAIAFAAGWLRARAWLRNHANAARTARGVEPRPAALSGT